ncbi:X-Pro dipeptidyl-peptidase protein [Phyllosticta citricarpa]|uniref:X-Pro dipeptidyl-peptidase protein n=2 Tax=Phyllosticta TaxID=121621 RepID=A0ABR1MBW7_9PEZI
MGNEFHNLAVVDNKSHPYIYQENVSVPLANGLPVRCNVYLPKDSEGKKFPVIVTYGPYGKDVPYKDFHAESFGKVDKDHQTDHSAWETPTPRYWTAHGYVVVRADEIGIGQSPGKLDVLSKATIDSFVEVIEWCAKQSWSTGKVGLLGISYYAATQWQVAARNPKGLAAMVPWEGFSDFYRDAFRHGGILSNNFFSFWWARQVGSNQYGLPGKEARHWGPDTIEGDLTEDELAANRVEQSSIFKYRYRDEERIESVNFDLEDVRVPLLSIANWGAISLHLRGNVHGFMRAGSEFKYLRFITGRHDLPFYYPEEVELQRSFLDAFLKGDDRDGWSRKGQVSPVELVVRKGAEKIGFNDPEAEKQFPRRKENEWPLARTEYKNLFLTPSGGLQYDRPDITKTCEVSYPALGMLQSPHLALFSTGPVETETEITGHIVAHLNVSVAKDPESGNVPSDLDLFLTLRHMTASGEQISYTGAIGEPVPVAKGWLRVSLRKTSSEHPYHASWLPHRDYRSTDVLPVVADEVYAVDVEIWPTSVVLEKGQALVLEVSSGDTDGAGIFQHNDPQDRSQKVFQGINRIHFGSEHVNTLIIPVIPSTQ